MIFEKQTSLGYHPHHRHHHLDSPTICSDFPFPRLSHRPCLSPPSASVFLICFNLFYLFSNFLGFYPSNAGRFGGCSSRARAGIYSLSGWPLALVSWLLVPLGRTDWRLCLLCLLIFLPSPPEGSIEKYRRKVNAHCIHLYIFRLRPCILCLYTIVSYAYALLIVFTISLFTPRSCLVIPMVHQFDLRPLFAFHLLLDHFYFRPPFASFTFCSFVSCLSALIDPCCPPCFPQARP